MPGRRLHADAREGPAQITQKLDAVTLYGTRKLLEAVGLVSEAPGTIPMAAAGMPVAVVEAAVKASRASLAEVK